MKKSIGIADGFFFCIICKNLTHTNMLPNYERLQIEIKIRPQIHPQDVIKSELIKVNYSIDRKFAILDEFSTNWTFTQWRNFKDALYGEISYREYLKLLQGDFK